MRLVILFLMAVVAWGACPNAPTGYAYCRPITIDNTKVSGSGNLTDFPMLFSVTANWAKSVANGGRLVDGEDLQFQLPAGTVLDYEVELWDAATGELVIWIRIPTLDFNDDTVIWVYYNKTGASGEEDAAGLWAAYLAVYHMNADPSVADEADVTGNGFTCVYEAGMGAADSITGAIGPAIQFDGTGEVCAITVDSSWELVPDTSSSFHVSIWLKPDNLSGPAAYVFNILGNHPALIFEFVADQFEYFSNPGDLVGGDPRTSSQLAVDTNWNHIVYNYDGASSNDWDGFLDGSQVMDRNVTWNVNFFGSGAQIAASNDSGADDVAAGIDEARVLKAFHTVDWTITEYASYNSPATFYAVGSEGTTKPVGRRGVVQF